jgi:hypothetical protein
MISTLDRFEGEMAVLIGEPQGTVVNVPRSDLPENLKQGDMLRFDGYVDQDETSRRRATVRARIDRLKKRG